MRPLLLPLLPMRLPLLSLLPLRLPLLSLLLLRLSLLSLRLPLFYPPQKPIVPPTLDTPLKCKPYMHRLSRT